MTQNLMTWKQAQGLCPDGVQSCFLNTILSLWTWLEQTIVTKNLFWFPLGSQRVKWFVDVWSFYDFFPRGHQMEKVTTQSLTSSQRLPFLTSWHIWKITIFTQHTGVSRRGCDRSTHSPTLYTPSRNGLSSSEFSVQTTAEHTAVDVCVYCTFS